MEISEKQLDWADNILIDVVADSNNPDAEKARLIVTMLAAQAFELQKRVDVLLSTPPLTMPNKRDPESGALIPGAGSAGRIIWGH